MKLNRMVFRAVSVGMVGTLVAATPAYASNENAGIAGIAAFFQNETAAANSVVGAAAMNFKNTGYINALKVLAGENVKYQMTEEETAAQVAMAQNIDAQAAVEKKASPYDNIAISQVYNYVNIRSGASENADIVGKIYNNAAATILDTIETENEGTWYHITSGSVEGYIKSNYFVTGEDAEAIAYEVGEVKATVTAETLRLRSQATVDSSTVTLLSEDERYDVVAYDDGFTKIQIDDDVTGYVASDYIDITVDFEHAISLEEEREAEEARRAAEESIAESEAEERREQEAREEEEEYDNDDEDNSDDEEYDEEDSSEDEAYDDDEDNGDDEEYDDEDNSDDEEYDDEDNSDDEEEETTKKETTTEEEEEEDDDDSYSSSSTRDAIVDYACSMVGNVRYVWGGTSLSSGVDCSGFVQQIFKHFGISLPRTSGEQGSTGRSVKSSNMQPGDLVYYGGHIAIYIGNGQVVHASNPQTGVKISTWNYRSPLSIRNVID